jgi:lipopolysaccharide export system protein LptC
MASRVADSSMELWTPRRATTLAEARRRTGIVHILRLLFTCGAVIAVGLFVGPVVSNAFVRGAPVAKSATSSATLLNPRFEGRDASGRPFVVIADTARQRRGGDGAFDLVRPRMQNDMQDTVDALTGVYDPKQEILDLDGDVVLTNASGYVFRADRARMFVNENRIEGQTQLVGTGPIGEIRADAYEVFDNGERILLTGNVWSKFVVDRDRPRRNDP